MPSLTPESRSHLLARVRADLSERLERGELARVEDYLPKYPDLVSDDEAVLELIGAEIVLRADRTGLPSLEEYLARFPERGEALRGRYPVYRMACGGAVPRSAGHTVSEDATAGGDEPATLRVTLPGFELTEKLGEGGMGVVFKARQAELDRVVAVKLVRAGPLAGQSLLARFRVEERAVARLDHPGVVRIFHAGQHEGWVYFCMEYAAGGSLADRLRSGPAVAPREAAEWARQLAGAMAHAHAAGVLHRDLKPGNVLLTADGKAAKVSDFGLAKLLDAEDGLTESGALLGTPAYMSPEQAEGRVGDIDARTDVYALGAILYQCLAGRPPFCGQTRTETLRDVSRRPPEPPPASRGVPAELEAVCLKCLEKSPSRRYQSAGELEADLRAWLAGGPTKARPARGLRRLARAVRLRPAASATCAAALLALAGAAVVVPRMDPNRPLRQAQAKLRQGLPVDLVTQAGQPVWWDVPKGKSRASFEAAPDGSWGVHGWPLTLVELMPDTAGLTSFTFRADVRQLQGGERGSVGLYFARKEYPGPSAPVSAFVMLTFHDLRDNDEGLARLPPQFRQGGAKVQDKNPVRLVARYHANDEAGIRLNLAFPLAQPRLFRPAGHGGKAGEWRALRVEVTPTRLRAFWGEEGVYDGPAEAVQKAFQGGHAEDVRFRPNNPELVGVAAEYAPGGGLGLYLHESFASFRDVRIEPASPEGAQ